MSTSTNYSSPTVNNNSRYSLIRLFFNEWNVTMAKVDIMKSMTLRNSFVLYCILCIVFSQQFLIVNSQYVFADRAALGIAVDTWVDDETAAIVTFHSLKNNRINGMYLKSLICLNYSRIKAHSIAISVVGMLAM